MVQQYCYIEHHDECTVRHSLYIFSTHWVY